MSQLHAPGGSRTQQREERIPRAVRLRGSSEVRMPVTAQSGRTDSFWKEPSMPRAGGRVRAAPQRTAAWAGGALLQGPALSPLPSHPFCAHGSSPLVFMLGSPHCPPAGVPGVQAFCQVALSRCSVSDRGRSRPTTGCGFGRLTSGCWCGSPLFQMELLVDNRISLGGWAL